MTEEELQTKKDRAAVAGFVEDIIDVVEPAEDAFIMVMACMNAAHTIVISQSRAESRTELTNLMHGYLAGMNQDTRITN